MSTTSPLLAIACPQMEWSHLLAEIMKKIEDSRREGRRMAVGISRGIRLKSTEAAQMVLGLT